VVCKSQLNRLRDEARHLSLCDALTGLANRRALMERLEGLGLRRASDAGGLLLLDVDRFRDVNTLYGHPAGDRVLREVADALRSAPRDSDLVARLGGDEFAIVAGGVDRAAMDRLAKRVTGALEKTAEGLDLPAYRLSASLGWAVYPDDARSVEELMAAADSAERTAKARGKSPAAPPQPALASK